MGTGYDGSGKVSLNDVQVVRRTISVASNVYRLYVDIIEI
jgi:hypothetical protein